MMGIDIVSDMSSTTSRVCLKLMSETTISIKMGVAFKLQEPAKTKYFIFRIDLLAEWFIHCGFMIRESLRYSNQPCATLSICWYLYERKWGHRLEPKKLFWNVFGSESWSYFMDESRHQGRGWHTYHGFRYSNCRVLRRRVIGNWVNKVCLDLITNLPQSPRACSIDLRFIHSFNKLTA